MVPKSRRNRLEMAYSSWEPGPNAPHLVYANLEFVGDAVPKGSRLLLRYLDWSLPSWTKEETLSYLKEHQAEFRKCLDWLSADSRVDFGPIKDEDDNGYFRERWEQKAEVKFLQQHGLDHGGVTLAPRSSDPIYPFTGLELDQKKPRDPLDPICWYMLYLLAGYGNVFVRRCRLRHGLPAKKADLADDAGRAVFVADTHLSILALLAGLSPPESAHKPDKLHRDSMASFMDQRFG